MGDSSDYKSANLNIVLSAVECVKCLNNRTCLFFSSSF